MEEQIGDALSVASPASGYVIELDRALKRLEEIDRRASRGVELRWFVGLDVREVAHVMEISEATVRRDWNFAKAWLQTEFDAQHKSDVDL